MNTIGRRLVAGLLLAGYCTMGLAQDSNPASAPKKTQLERAKERRKEMVRRASDPGYVRSLLKKAAENPRPDGSRTRYIYVFVPSVSQPNYWAPRPPIYDWRPPAVFQRRGRMIIRPGQFAPRYDNGGLWRP